jgi:inorganic triphosphatase YgiF
LHDLRIAAKRLRYTLEVFGDVLPAASQAVVKELSRIQDEIGALHDSDVMIALLRLCLGSQDSGMAYEEALVDTKKKYQSKKGFTLPADLIADLLEPGAAPSAEQRYGLERMLLMQQQGREKQYSDFRQHWYQLQARDFRREILDILDSH